MNREIIKANADAFLHWASNGQFSVLYRYRNDLTDKFNDWEVISTLHPMEDVLNLYNKDVQFVINDEYVHLRRAEKEGAQIMHLKLDTRDNLWSFCKGPIHFGLYPVEDWKIYKEPIKPGTVYKLKNTNDIYLITDANEEEADCITMIDNEIILKYIDLVNTPISHIPDYDYTMDDLELWTPIENELCVSTGRSPLSKSMFEANDLVIEVYKTVIIDNPNKRAQPTYWYPIESLKLFNYYFGNTKDE